MPVSHDDLRADVIFSSDDLRYTFRVDVRSCWKCGGIKDDFRDLSVLYHERLRSDKVCLVKDGEMHSADGFCETDIVDKDAVTETILINEAALQSFNIIKGLNNQVINVLVDDAVLLTPIEWNAEEEQYN